MTSEREARAAVRTTTDREREEAIWKVRELYYQVVDQRNAALQRIAELMRENEALRKELAYYKAEDWRGYS